jgi:hypothetical protein
MVQAGSDMPAAVAYIRPHHPESPLPLLLCASPGGRRKGRNRPRSLLSVPARHGGPGSRRRRDTRAMAAIPARSRCLTEPAPSSVSRPPARHGRGGRPGSAMRTRPSPRPSLWPAGDSVTTVPCGTACACSSGCSPSTSETATCRWCRPGAGVVARIARFRSAADRGGGAGGRLRACGGGHRRQGRGLDTAPRPSK